MFLVDARFVSAPRPSSFSVYDFKDLANFHVHVCAFVKGEWFQGELMAVTVSKLSDRFYW